MRLILRAGGSDAARSFLSEVKRLWQVCVRQVIFCFLEGNAFVSFYFVEKTVCLFVRLCGRRLLPLFHSFSTLQAEGTKIVFGDAKIRCFLGIFLGVSRGYGLCLSCPVIQKMSRRRGANPAARLFISYAYRYFFPAIRCRAICTALSAAPFLIWSPTTQKESPRSSAMSLRTRPT